jgi:hypothetical protein
MKEELMRSFRIAIITTTFVGIVAGVIPSCSAKTPSCCKKTAAQGCCASAPAVSDSSVLSMQKNIPDRTILFFMNPNGRPCQMQKAVLDGMGEKLAGLAQVTYIKTTESTDQDKFSHYGIRGLPSLIIVDKNGNEIMRFSPGIQSEETILAALQKKPADK